MTLKQKHTLALMAIREKQRTRKMKQAVIGTLIMLVFAAVKGHAATLYFVNGAQVSNQGEAKKAGLKDPKADIVKISATRVQLNQDNLNLKKSGEVSTSDISKLINSAK